MKLAPNRRGGVGVVIDIEHKFVSGRVKACSTTDHLVKGNRRFNVSEEDDIGHWWYINASSEQVDGGGDEVAFGTATEIGQIILTSGGSTFEREIAEWFCVVLVAPFGIEVVEFVGDRVSVGIADAEDDGLLSWITRLTKVVKEVAAPFNYAVGEHNLSFKSTGCVVFINCFKSQGISGYSVSQFGVAEVFTFESGF